MKEITLVMQTSEQVFESQGVTPDDIEDLHSIGGLVPLLNYLKNSHVNIRAKAADVVSMIVQNNPRSQQLVMESNGLEYLLSNFTSDPDVKARTQALGAISSTLKDALSSENVRFQRKALNLIQYLLHENNGDCDVVSELGFPLIIMHLTDSEDSDVQEAALRGLLELARDKADGTSGRLSEDDEKLKQLLEERIRNISSLTPDDLGAAKEERQLVDSIWNTLYKEPSSLQERGLLVLPGEDMPPPDVSSQHFEPPLRAFSARDASKNSAEQQDNKPPLLLGPGPPSS